MPTTRITQLAAVSALAVLTACAPTNSVQEAAAVGQNEPPRKPVDAGNTYNGGVPWCEKVVVSETASGKEDARVEPRGDDLRTMVDGALSRPDACLALESLFQRRLNSRWKPKPEHFIRADNGRVLGFRRRVGVPRAVDGRPKPVTVEQVGVRMIEPDSGMSATFIFMGVEYASAVPGPDELRKRIEYDSAKARWRWSGSDDFKLERVLMRASHGECGRARVDWQPEGDSIPAVGQVLREIEGDQRHRSVDGATQSTVEATGWSDEVENGVQLAMLQSVDEIGRRRGLRVYTGRRLDLVRRSAYGTHGLRAVEAIDAFSIDGKGRADGRVDEVRTHEFDRQGRLARKTTRVVAFDDGVPIGQVPPEMRSVRFDGADAGNFVEPSSRIVSREVVEAYSGDRVSRLWRTELRGEHGFVYDEQGRLIEETLDGRIEGSKPYAGDYDGQADRRVEHAYDADGHRTKSAVLENGRLIRLTTFEYDDRGRVVREHVQENSQPRSNPNAHEHNLNTVRDWTHEYGPNSQKMASRFTSRDSANLEGSRSYEYEDGRLVEMRTYYPARSKSTRRFQYDASGNLVEEVAYGVPYRPKTFVIRHEYDDSGRRLRTRRGELVLEYEYQGDRLDRIVASRTTTMEFVYECEQ